MHCNLQVFVRMQVCVRDHDKTEMSCHSEKSLTQHPKPVQPPVCIPKDGTNQMIILSLPPHASSGHFLKDL